MPRVIATPCPRGKFAPLINHAVVRDIDDDFSGDAIGEAVAEAIQAVRDFDPYHPGFCILVSFTQE